MLWLDTKQQLWVAARYAICVNPEPNKLQGWKNFGHFWHWKCLWLSCKHYSHQCFERRHLLGWYWFQWLVSFLFLWTPFSCQINRALSTFSQCLTHRCIDSSRQTWLTAQNSSSCLNPPSCIKKWGHLEPRLRETTQWSTAMESPSSPKQPHSMTWPSLSLGFKAHLCFQPLSSGEHQTNILGSAAITSVVYNPTSQFWTVVVSASLAWPYKLVEPGWRCSNQWYGFQTLKILLSNLFSFCDKA